MIFIPKIKKKIKFPGARLAYEEFFKNKKKLIKEYYCKSREILVIKKL